MLLIPVIDSFEWLYYNLIIFEIVEVSQIRCAATKTLQRGDSYSHLIGAWRLEQKISFFVTICYIFGHIYTFSVFFFQEVKQKR